MKYGVTEYLFEPVGLDLFDKRPHHPDVGTRVIKCQPHNTPKNGTMRHCYVADAITREFYGLVLETSLQKVTKKG